MKVTGALKDDDRIMCDLSEKIDEFKEKVKPGMGIRRKDDIGEVNYIYPNFAFCKSITGNYSFSVSFVDLALGNAEVI